MKIYISKDGNKTGPLTEKEIKGMIWAGIVTPEDLGMKEGETNWKSLRLLLDDSQTPALQTSSTPVQEEEQEKKDLVDSTADLNNVKEVKEDEEGNSIDNPSDDIINVNEEKEIQESKGLLRQPNEILETPNNIEVKKFRVFTWMFTISGFVAGGIVTSAMKSGSEIYTTAGKLGAGGYLLGAICDGIVNYFRGRNSSKDRTD